MSKTQHSINCNCVLNPMGADCQVSIQWGLDANYGNIINLPIVPAGWSDVQVQGVIPNLDGSTTYHWRFVAVSTVGEADGADVTDTTLADVPELPVISNETGTAN